jgi:hypothetical protein
VRFLSRRALLHGQPDARSQDRALLQARDGQWHE